MFVIHCVTTVKSKVCGLFCYHIIRQDFIHFLYYRPQLGSVVVERSPGIRVVGGSISGTSDKKTLKFEVLLLCFNSAQHIRVRDRLAGSESG